MRVQKGSRAAWLSGVVLAGGMLWASMAGAQSYHVVVDTSSLAGADGFFDFQLNPADLSAAAATAMITAMAGDFTLLGTPVIEGDVSATLPQSIMLTNSTAFNDLFQSATFGNSLSFDVSFSGDFQFETSLSSTSFALSLYAADGTTPLLTTDPSGSLLRFELAAAGITFQAFPAAQVAPVPLPAAAWLLLSGALGLARISRRSKQ